MYDRFRIRTREEGWRVVSLGRGSRSVVLKPTFDLNHRFTPVVVKTPAKVKTDGTD